MSTYLSTNAIKQEIKRIKSGDPESTLYGVWNAILNLQFPVSEGYITRPQDEHTMQSGAKGYSDLHTFHYRNGSDSADKFLIAQFKRAGFEGRSSVWAEGIDQLDRYLGATHKTRAYNDRTPVYGIIAIGKLMRVYKYDDRSRSVYNWSPRGVEKGKAWHLKDDDEKIQKILDSILQRH